MNYSHFDACPLCGGMSSDVLFSAETVLSDYHIVRCGDCFLTRTFPLPADDIVPAGEISKYYGKGGNKFIPLLQRIRNRITGSRARHYLALLPEAVERPRVLDIGCAEGRLLHAFLDLACECWGVEHASYPSERFLGNGQIRYMQGDMSSLPLPEGAFDLIFLWHVLEHMDDPRAVMGRLYRLLAPGGILIVAVPNFSGLEAGRFKASWFHLDIPWHKYHFDERSLGYLLGKNRLRIVKRSSFCLEQGPFGLLQSVLNTMGWPGNECYEALKGNYARHRSLPLTIQFCLMLFLLGPALLASLITSVAGRGSVLKLIIEKE